jgi:hypothetical protein
MVKRYRESALVKKKRRKLNKKKIKKYAKKGKGYIDGGVRIWNRLNNPKNKKGMAKLGKRASKMQENILDII